MDGEPMHFLDSDIQIVRVKSNYEFVNVVLNGVIVHGIFKKWSQVELLLSER